MFELRNGHCVSLAPIGGVTVVLETKRGNNLFMWAVRKILRIAGK